MTQQLPDVPNILPALVAEHTTTVTSGWPLARIHDLAGYFPTKHHQPRWSAPHPGKGRFDHHPHERPRDHAPDHGIIYTATDDSADLEHPPVATRAAVPGNALDALAEFVQPETELVITAGLDLTVVAPAAQLQLLDVGASWGQATRAGPPVHRRAPPHPAVGPRDPQHLPAPARDPVRTGDGRTRRDCCTPRDRSRRARGRGQCCYREG